MQHLGELAVLVADPRALQRFGQPVGHDFGERDVIGVVIPARFGRDELRLRLAERDRRRHAEEEEEHFLLGGRVVVPRLIAPNDTLSTASGTATKPVVRRSTPLRPEKSCSDWANDAS